MSLAAALSPALADAAGPRDTGRGFDVEEFRRRIRDRERVTLREADRHAREVLAALAPELAGGRLDAPDPYAPRRVPGNSSPAATPGTPRT